MITRAVPDRYLLQRFQEFSRALHRIQKQAAGTSSSSQISPHSASSETLARLLERQAAEAREVLDVNAFEIYREAQYVMAALADDLLSRPAAPGQPAWESLEQRFFRANSAGEVFFQKLEYLLQGQNPEHIELARLYFFAICLGFQGEYRAAHDLAPLMAYRHQLFVRIFSEQPTLMGKDTPLVQLAPVQTVRREEFRSLPHPQIWLALPAGVLLLWVVFSFVFWTGYLRPIARRMNTSVHSTVADGR